MSGRYFTGFIVGSVVNIFIWAGPFDALRGYGTIGLDVGPQTNKTLFQKGAAALTDKEKDQLVDAFRQALEQSVHEGEAKSLALEVPSRGVLIVGSGDKKMVFHFAPDAPK